MRSFGSDLADLLQCNVMLAFDIGGDEDEEFLSRHQSSNNAFENDN